MKQKPLSTGFIATKGTQKFEVTVEVYETGFYIITHQNDKLINQTTRNTLKKVETILNNHRHDKKKSGFVLQEKPTIGILLENGFFRQAQQKRV